jgi:eukaryotic-like serine/threonine-protein kinase
MREADGVAEKTDPQVTETLSGRNLTPDPEATLISSAAATLSAAERASEAKSIGPYHLIRKVGEGGMGQVWLAEQTAPIKRQVALKLIRVGRFDDSVLQRFYAERQSLALMDHPAIAKVFDAGATSDGQPYFVMEYVPGQPLTDYCDRKRLKIRERLELFIKVCEGVQHAHQKAIMHRDLKPANILVVEVDGKPVPRIIDFGLAKAASPQLDGETLALMTQAGGWVGTPGYMSPEQADPGVMDVDTRTDVYSLGAVLYVLLTGSLPFETNKQRFDAFLRRLREEDPLRPSFKVSGDHKTSKSTAEARGSEPKQLASLLHGDLDWITMKALEKDRARRYGSPMELAADIGRYLGNEPVTARPASMGYRAKKYVLRHKALVAGAAAVFLVLVAGVITSTWQAVKARRAEAQAKQQSAIAQAVNDFLQKDLLAQASSFNQSRPDPDMKVRSALDRAAQNIEGKFKGQPAVEAAIRSTIGETYSDLGLYADSRKQLEKALELSRGSLGPDNLKTLQIMVSLGWLAQEQGHIEEAEKLQKQALDAGRRALGATNPTTLTALRRLGGVYLQEGKYPQAEATLSEALEGLKRVNGSDNLDILSATNNLGAVYKQEGKFAQAEAMYRHSWDISKRLFGADSPKTLPSMGNLGILLNHVGKKSEAEDIDRQTLDIARRGLGPEHPYALMAMDILAITCAEQGKYAEAESLNNQEFEIKRRVLGPDHPETLRALGNLGEDYALAGNYPRAEEFLSQAVEAEKRTVGFRNDLTLDHMNILADAYVKDRQAAKAEQLDFQVFTKRRELLGAGNPDTIQSLNALVRDYKAEGKVAQADELLKQAHAPQPEKPAQAAQ